MQSIKNSWTRIAGMLAAVTLVALFVFISSAPLEAHGDEEGPINFAPRFWTYTDEVTDGILNFHVNLKPTDNLTTTFRLEAVDQAGFVLAEGQYSDSLGRADLAVDIPDEGGVEISAFYVGEEVGGTTWFLYSEGLSYAPVFQPNPLTNEVSVLPNASSESAHGISLTMQLKSGLNVITTTEIDGFEGGALALPENLEAGVYGVYLYQNDMMLGGTLIWVKDGQIRLFLPYVRR
jgi:hypothetical protein